LSLACPLLSSQLYWQYCVSPAILYFLAYVCINYVSSSLHAMGLARKISFEDPSLTSELFFIFKVLLL